MVEDPEAPKRIIQKILDDFRTTAAEVDKYLEEYAKKFPERLQRMHDNGSLVILADRSSQFHDSVRQFLDKDKLPILIVTGQCIFCPEVGPVNEAGMCARCAGPQA